MGVWIRFEFITPLGYRQSIFFFKYIIWLTIEVIRELRRHEMEKYYDR